MKLDFNINQYLRFYFQVGRFSIGVWKDSSKLSWGTSSSTGWFFIVGHLEIIWGM